MSSGVVILTTVAGITIVLLCLLVARAISIRRERYSAHVVEATNEINIPNKLLTPDQYAAQQTSFIDNQSALQQRFLSIVSQSGKPKGLTWKSCQFDETIIWAIEKQSANLHALLSTVIHFDAIAGGPMEDVEAVGRVRAATAVFLYERGAWLTEGRVVFNLDPEEAVEYYQNELELIPQESQTG